MTPGIGDRSKGRDRLGDHADNRSMDRRLYHLQDFFLSYFHPDWHLDAGSRGDVVREYLAVAEPSEVANVVDDLVELLARPMTEDELHDHVLDRYSLFHDPSREGVSMRAWLSGLVEELTATSS